MTEAARPVKTRKKGRWLALALLPFVLFALAEAVLRAAGVGRPEPLFTEMRSPAVHQYWLNLRGAFRDLPPDLARRAPEPGFQAFEARKPEGWRRIFCLGGTTTSGFPFPNHLSYPSLLQEKLRLLLPHETIEVVNCGIPTAGSFTLVDFTREALAHEPDLLVVYTGHEEFYGPRGAASTAGPGRAPAWAVGLVRRLLDLRAGSWLRSRLERPDLSPGGLAEKLAARRGIRPDGALHSRGLDDYGKNIRRIIRLCRDAGVALVFCEPVCNLAEQYPFGTMTAEGLDSESRRLELWGLEHAFMSEGATATAEEVFARWKDLSAQEPGSADLWFHGGFLAARMGDGETATRLFTEARDKDTVHWRACTPFLETLRTACADEGVALVGLVGRFQETTRGVSPGNDLFIGRVEPNLAGQLLIAESIGRTLEEIGWPHPEAHWHRQEGPDDWTVLQMAGITPLDLLYAELRAGQEKTTWPHALPAAGVVSDFRRFAQADPLREPLSRHVYEEARLYWERAPDRIDAAFEEDVFWYDEPDSILLGVAERVITGDVNLMEGHRRLGAHYEHAGLLPEAFREYRTAARILPIEPDNYTGAARVLLRAEYPERAKAYLQQTLRLSPGTPDIMARMAECEFKLGRREEMQTWLDRTLAIDPGNAKALSLMRRVAGSSADSAHVPR